MPDNVVRPFKLSVPESVLEDLRQRLLNVRLPDEPPLAPWSTGTSVAYLKKLLAYWRDGFDWRAQEAKLNAFRQFTVPLGGVDVHFIHEEGKGPNPMPLLLCHGWPGSVMEFHKLLPMLTDPARFGGDPADAFSVIAPSLPGYVFSFKPGQKRFSIEEIAEVFAAPITAFTALDGIEDREVVLNGRPRTLRIYRLGRHRVWGVTARIVQNLVERLGLGGAAATG